MMKKKDRIIRKDERGVSEVVGSILTLAVTVIIFTAIFWGVQNIEPPERQSYVRFSTSVYMDTDDHVFVNITNMGGGRLRGHNTRIYLFVNDTGRHDVTFGDDTYGNDLADGVWRIGDTLNLHYENETAVGAAFNIWNATVSVLMIDDEINQRVYNEEIKSVDRLPPFIRDLGVYYPLDYLNYAQPGDTVTLYVDLVDKDTYNLDDITVSVNLSVLDGYDDSPTYMTRITDKPLDINRYILSGITIAREQDEGNYLLPIEAKDRFRSEFNYSISLNIGESPATTEDARLAISRITFNPSVPISGQQLYVTATINNNGGASTLANVTFTNHGPDGNVSNIAWPDVQPRIAAGGGVDITLNWVVRRAGVHNITVTAEYNDRIVTAYRHLVVRPNILIVDNEQAADDDVSHMVRALSSAGFDAHRMKVGPGNRPRYEDGTPPLKNYDIVIWMTGAQTVNTITDFDRDELEKFLSNGHRLWLIGEGIAYDAESNGWAVWLEENLKSIITATNANAPQGDMEGVGEPVIGESFSRRAGVFYGDYLNPVSLGLAAIEDNAGVVAVAYNGTHTRTFFQSIRFASLEEEKTASRTRLAYNVILWLGNITDIGGNDLALSSQTFYPESREPNYMETVYINATVRNNGPDTLNPRIVLEVNGNRVAHDDPQIEGGGKSVEVEFTWIAEPVGEHVIRVIIDPHNSIPETNIMNNNPDYLGINTTVNVRYTTLIVDDERDDGDTATRIRDIYNDLGYAFDYVDLDEDEPPSTDDMARYNTICWVTGGRQDALTVNNRDNIREFLLERTGMKNFILIGDHILNYLKNDVGDTEFIEDVLRIDPDSISERLAPTLLTGTFNDPVSHGMRYYTDFGTTSNAFYYEPLEGAPILQDTHHGTIAHRYFNPNRYRLVFTSFDIDHFSSPVLPTEQHWYDRYDLNTSVRSMQGEFLYMVNRWFGNIDNRVELRMSPEDITISDTHPMLGRTYQITVRVQNVGGTPTSALVRFRDGLSHLGSVSAFVPPNGFSDVEIMWQPLHAGPGRPIRVVVDAIHEVPEIPNQPGVHTEDDYFGFNNQAILYTPVYYFWDDMQDDARVRDNWVHEAQIALINGETPLDFMGGLFDDIDTNVAGNWDRSMSHGVVNTTDEAKSDPYSYFMLEPKGGRLMDVLLVIAIDNSRSMDDRLYEGQTWLWHAKQAAKVLVDSLSNGSAVGLYRFGATNPVPVLEPTILDEAGRTLVHERIDGIAFAPMTSLWDIVGESYEMVRDEQENFPEHIPAVVILSDGADNRASDNAPGGQTPEEGSRDWAPWHDMDPEDNYPTVTYTGHKGKYRLPYYEFEGPYDPGEWRDVGILPQWRVRSGLLNSPIRIFTIGLGLEHNPNIPNWNPAQNFESAGDDNYLIDRDPGDVSTWESGTTEYNLWRIANTSGAEYFFAPDPGDLGDIFERIAYMLQRTENLTAIEDEFVINQGDGREWIRNFDKYAVTPRLDLTNTSDAWLTFWHKYRLIQGVNGAYMEVGYEDPDEPGQYLWRYVKPSVGPYTGNLLLSEIDSDDFDNDIIWCWNGKSAGGTMQWEFVKVDLLRDDYQIPEDKLNTVRIRFYYKQFGGGIRPGGWWLDDVSVVVTRIGNTADNIVAGMHDVWHLNETTGPDGQSTRAWRNADPDEGFFRPGIDNRLVTAPIHLTNARTATLSADFKFNINTAGGRPPDGFRVEVSTDNGISWQVINLGVRAATGVSGSGGDAGQNIGYNWTTAGHLDRLNVDLSEFAGNVILIRFRVFTCSASGYNHYADPSTYGGFYVNNVMVLGETLQE